eukprot:Nitzschia sp. Nitz4//scaffold22_size323478//204694//207041//NITZ4_000557-RA/size323478-augustus-gene-0.208-mRNA-1//1//CDS//3329543085//1155//frame0
MSSIGHFLFNNAYDVDAKAQETKLREKEPLLLGDEEHIELALKEGLDSRDKTYFTTHRILVKDGKGIGKKRKNYKSIPYATIQGFAVTTAGFMDDDTELELWGSAGTLQLNLSKQVNLFQLQQFLSAKVMSFSISPQATQDPVDVRAAGMLSTFSSWISGDSYTFDNEAIAERFKKETPVLLAEEEVEIAFKTGRDFLIFTNHRIIRVDVQGLLGKKVEFESILWTAVSAATISTSAGFFDRDLEMILHTSIEPIHKKDRTRIEMDFRKGKVDIYAVKKIIANHILGPDQDPLEHVDAGKSGWSWANLFDREASRPIDPKTMDHNLRTNPALLRVNEHVELAFKGIRDIFCFTTQRLIIVDPKGVSGKRVEYTSLPYKSILGFAIETAGAVMDLDTEVMLYTDMNIIAEDKSQDPPEPSKPGMALLELEFNKKLVNLFGLKKYLSQRILQAARGDEAIPEPPSFEPNETILGNFFSYFSDNQRVVNPRDIDEQLHTTAPLLLDDEHVAMAFKAGRDMTLLTNLRMLVMDVQGLSGKRVSYHSIPYTSIRAFTVRSAGSWDTDSELCLYTGNLWELSKVDMDFRKGQVDILSIHRFLSAMLMGDAEECAQYLDPEGAALSIESEGGLGNFINWLGSNTIEQDAAAADEQLHSDPPILLGTEHVDKIFKTGRDMFIYTTHRVLIIDVQGLRGKKVEYQSIPHHWIHGFEVETAGHLDRDAEVYLRNDIPGMPKVEQDILVSRGDVMEMQKYLTEKLVISD